MTTKYETDAISHRKPDSGCAMATEYLGHQSHCLVNCPFPLCSENPGGKPALMKLLRRQEINRLFEEGKSVEKIMSLLNVSIYTVNRAIK